jgi:hypothetical protein
MLSTFQHWNPTHVAKTLKTVLCEHSREQAASQCQIGCNSLDRHGLLRAAAAARFLTRCAHTLPSETQGVAF